MWNGIWNKIKIKSITNYKKDPTAVKPDSVEVTITMPIEVYSVFRLQIEAPNTLNNRRATDQEDPSPHAPPTFQLC